TFNLRCPATSGPLGHRSSDRVQGKPSSTKLLSLQIQLVGSFVYLIMLTMEEAMKQADMRFAAGEIVKGYVIEVRPKEVLVDIGYKSEGVIPGNEFDDIKTVKVGDEVDVLIEKLEDKEGMVVLSKEKAEFKKNWDKILTICNEGGTINGKVKAVVKGGLL